MNELSGGVSPILFPWVLLDPLERFAGWLQNVQSFLPSICGLIASTWLLKCFLVRREGTVYAVKYCFQQGV